MRSSIYALAVIALLASARISASYITMVTDYFVTEGPGGLTINLKARNQGDEPAYGIQFEVQIGNRNFTSPVVPQLGVNETTSSDFSIHDVFHLPGHYPVFVKIHYQDANTYPFTALSIGFYDFQHPVVSKVLIRAEDATIPSNGMGTMKYTVRNNDSVERDLTLTLHLPDELATLKHNDSLIIGPGQSRSLQYAIENFSALENSSYAIALVAEYEDGKRHYATAGSGTIRITAPGTLGGYMAWVVAAVTAVTLVFLIIIRIRRN